VKDPTKIPELWEDLPLPPGKGAPLGCSYQLQEPYKEVVSQTKTQ
jgi:hypothetical protein